jgi:four helix bundle protein
MNKDELKKRTKDFAHRCVKLAIVLPKTQLGKHITGQLIRCSTSVAANYRACCLAQSKASFVAKLSIVLEEIDESSFWLEFITDEQIMKEKMVTPLLNEALELTSIFFASRKTARKNNIQYKIFN